MLINSKQKQTFLLIIMEILMMYLGFWFLLKNLETNGIWETVILNVLFFLIFPLVVLKNKSEIFENSKQKINIVVSLQILAIWAMFSFLFLKAEEISFFKLNYLARVDWFLNDWWILFFLDLVLLPIIIYSQEFFFRNFIVNKLGEVFSDKIVILIQAIIFLIFEVLFFGFFSWMLVLFNFILAIFLGIFYIKTKSIWYSFFTRWGLILLLDGFILYKIQNIKL